MQLSGAARSATASEPAATTLPFPSYPRSNRRWRFWHDKIRSTTAERPDGGDSAPDVIKAYMAKSKGPHAVAIEDNTCGCGPLAAADVVGPLLRYKGYDPVDGEWSGSVLVVCKTNKRPRLILAIQDQNERMVDADQLDVYQDWVFWRFSVEILSADWEQHVQYKVLIDDSTTRAASFVVAGLQQSWHWGFYSCSGFSNDISPHDQCKHWRGLDPLWEDVIERHKQQPMHLTVGGGDQLYNDDVFQLPSMNNWLKCESIQEKREATFTAEMAEQVEAYYFHHYCTHFSHGAIGWAYANIPYAMTWDDHDIIDGWGSYPSDLQDCDVFQGMFQCISRFYLLFQQHTTRELARADGLFGGGQSWSSIMLLGPRVALVMMDQRAERDRSQVISVESYMELLSRLHKLPASVRHVVMVATVPVVYPHFLGAIHLLGCFKGMTRMTGLGWALKQSGMRDLLVNKLDEPELLDDVQDHWNSASHIDERRFLVEHLQMVAKAKQVRVTLISGDVHLAAAGQLYSFPKMRQKRLDFRYMPQVVSSAICNAPPSINVVRALHVLGRAGFTNHHTKNKMVKKFTDHRARKRLLNMRNWCEVHEASPGMEGGRDGGELVFTYRVEDTHNPPAGGLRPGNLKTYETRVAVLEVQPGSPQMRRMQSVYRST